jgi:hypothetical protein
MNNVQQKIMMATLITQMLVKNVENIIVNVKKINMKCAFH